MKTKKLIFKLLLLGAVFVSCDNDDVIEVKVNQNIFEDINSNVLISSEGNFGSKDGSISYFTPTSSNVFYYDSVNGAPLGGLIQSVGFNDGKVYIILNDVNTIVVVNQETFKKEAIIQTGLSNPRYITFVGDKGYVTNWGNGADTADDYVAEIDLSTNKVVSTISLRNGVEQIISNQNTLFVSHKGAFGTEKIVSVVKLEDKSVTEITVNDKPDELLFDSNGNVVVLCEGEPTKYSSDYSRVLESTTSSISFIDVTNNTVSKTLEFKTGDVPTKLSLDNETLYYYLENGEIHAIAENANSLSTNSVYTSPDAVYGLGVKEGKIFTLKYAFKTLSELTVYDIDSKEVEFETAIGLGASKVYFLN